MQMSILTRHTCVNELGEVASHACRAKARRSSVSHRPPGPDSTATTAPGRPLARGALEPVVDSAELDHIILVAGATATPEPHEHGARHVALGLRGDDRLNL